MGRIEKVVIVPGSRSYHTKTTVGSLCGHTLCLSLLPRKGTGAVFLLDSGTYSSVFPQDTYATPGKV